MDDQNKNLILATVLSFLVIIVWFVMFPPPEPELVETLPPSATTPEAGNSPVTAIENGVTASGSAAAAGTAAVADAPRVKIDTARLAGSISLQGGRIDELKLKDYHDTIEEGSPIVTLLSPVGTENSYYALYGWAPGAGLSLDQVPGANTIWQVEGNDTLTSTAPVTLKWDNGAGLVFRNEISVDDDTMFTVAQSVENLGAGDVSLAPYGILTRHGEPANLKKFFILHEGAIRQSGKEMNEINYDDIVDFATDPSWGPASEVVSVEGNGWIGFTDHYWMATLIPDGDQAFTSVLRHDARRDTYEAVARLQTMTVAEGTNAQVKTRLFAGAKEWETIRHYENDTGVYRFIDSIDWGWFFFLTKPIFAVLHFMNQMIGNMGVSIIALTLLIKAILFPLAYKSYVSMAKMKELQPEMAKIKERAGDDRQALQQDMMQLYRKEKVNPASGCLPILLQIPIFFSLYKVIFVTLELRHAPFFGPFQDLSAPDPTSLLNLFGLLPWAGPEAGSVMALAFIGILPLLLGISMFVQQKLNPAPTDPTQQMIFAWMPWIFMFMLGSFASGLVVYWIANNTITFTQQYLIMRSQGYKPDVFGNIIGGFRRKPKDDAK